uniref:Uncharacterized protein n=1 Tax=Anguilla anguilla TaxID=7936 RepID=A0A0E9WWD0_ANGAN
MYCSFTSKLDSSPLETEPVFFLGHQELSGRPRKDASLFLQHRSRGVQSYPEKRQRGCRNFFFCFSPPL